MKISLLLISCSLFLSGCLVGPNYHPPTVMLPDVYSEDRLVETDEFVDEDLAHWWTAFNDPFLNDLLAESLRGNFDLLVALEQVCQARANYWVQVTAILPELDSDLQITRSRTSQTLINPIQGNSNFLFPPFKLFIRQVLMLYGRSIFLGAFGAQQDLRVICGRQPTRRHVQSGFWCSVK